MALSTKAIIPKPGGSYEQANKVYQCCANYYAVQKNYTGTCKCQICGRTLTTPLTVPRIYLLINK